MWGQPPSPPGFVPAPNLDMTFGNPQHHHLPHDLRQSDPSCRLAREAAHVDQSEIPGNLVDCIGGMMINREPNGLRTAMPTSQIGPSRLRPRDDLSDAVRRYRYTGRMHYPNNGLLTSHPGYTVTYITHGEPTSCTHT